MRNPVASKTSFGKRIGDDRMVSWHSLWQTILRDPRTLTRRRLVADGLTAALGPRATDSVKQLLWSVSSNLAFGNTRPVLPDYDISLIENAVIDPQIDAYIDVLHRDVETVYAEQLSSAPWVFRYFENARLRMNVTIDLARRWEGLRGADIGIAFGFYDLILRDIYGIEVIGTELPENIQLYCDFPRSRGLEVRTWRLGKEAAPFTPASLDFVIFAEVLEHLKMPPRKTIQTLIELLRPGGQLLLTTPNVCNYNYIRKLMRGENIYEYFRDDIDLSDDPTNYMKHIREYSIAEVIALIQSAGLSINEVVMCNWGQPHFVPEPYLNDIICAVATKPH